MSQTQPSPQPQAPQALDSVDSARKHEPENKPEQRSGVISIVGPTNAGKSTLLNALVGEKVSIVTPKAHTTRNRILGIRQTESAQIVFVDTPGFLNRAPRKRTRGGKQRAPGVALARYLTSALQDGVQGADAILFTVDGRALIRDSEQITSLKSTIEQYSRSGRLIIVINKIDLIDRKQLLPVLARFDALFGPDSSIGDTNTGDSKSASGYVAFVPVSAKTGDGLERLAQLLEEQLPHGPPLFPADVVSDQPESFLIQEIVREKLFLQLGDELPYASAVCVQAIEEEGDLLKVAAVILVEREPQKRIVVGSRGRRIKAVGTAAREELEKILNCRIYLNLFVKVEDNWTKSAHGLSKAGYTASSPYSAPLE